METENNMIVSGRSEFALQEVPLNSDIAKISGEIALIQEALITRAAGRDK